MLEIGQRGLAMVKMLLFTVILLALASFGARSTQIELRISQNDYLDKRALAIADAGIQHAFRQIESDVSGGAVSLTQELQGTAGGFRNIGSAATIGGTSYRFRAFGGGSSDGYYVRVRDDFDELAGVDDPTVDVDKRIVIVSRGRIDLGGGRVAERIIEATVGQVPLFADGLFAKISARLRGGGNTDSYNSANGPYDPNNHLHHGDVGSNGDISMSGTPTTIDGSATAGGSFSQGSSPAPTGGYTAGAPQKALPPVPACSPLSGATGITGGSYRNGDLTGNGQDTITVSWNNGNGGVYCFDSVVMTGGADIVIDTTTGCADPSGCPVILNVIGEARFEGDSVNNTSNLAKNFQLYVTNGPVRIGGNSDLYATVYAPNADVTFDGGGNVFGAAVGGTVDVTGGARFHYDESLAGLNSYATAFLSWHEVRS